MFYYLSNSSPKSLKWPFSRMQRACDANIKMGLPGWVMGGANNSKWGDENSIAHTCSLPSVVPLPYWMGESLGETVEWITKRCGPQALCMARKLDILCVGGLRFVLDLQLEV